MLLPKRDKKYKNKSCIQGVEQVISKIFQTVLCVTAEISLKYHENRLIHFTVVLLTDTLQRLDGSPRNGLGRRETI